MVQIIEVLGRAKQGMTLPFICRGDDDKIYFVKGIGAGRRSQVCEWVCGNLALELGIPIAPFRIVDVPEELVMFNPDLSQLGVGPAFASERQLLMELNYSAVSTIPDDEQRRVLAFDWWIRNEDRKLTVVGGNPNLFWEPEQQRLVVIDHNQAFDSNFNVPNFTKFHVFSEKLHSVFSDLFYQKEFAKQFELALQCWENICATIPEEWNYVDLEQTVPANFDLSEFFAVLSRYKNKNFWSEK